MEHYAGIDVSFGILERVRCGCAGKGRRAVSLTGIEMTAIFSLSS
jgi:hypothetical protein